MFSVADRFAAPRYHRGDPPARSRVALHESRPPDRTELWQVAARVLGRGRRAGPDGALPGRPDDTARVARLRGYGLETHRAAVTQLPIAGRHRRREGRGNAAPPARALLGCERRRSAPPGRRRTPRELSAGRASDTRRRTHHLRQGIAARPDPR